jgi:PAS domain S-box-containing protein
VDAIVSADSSGRVLTWNRGAERLFGWTADEMVGRPLTVVIPERFRALHSDGIARVRRSGTSKLAGTVVELSGLRRDGSEVPIQLSIGTWNGPEGMAFSGVLRDITERKRAEDELAAANKELERANAELETLVYSASHDLKSPMVSLLGYLEYLRLDFGEVLGPEGNRYLNRMADSTVYMQQLIHHLIDLSRAGRSGVEPIEVDLGRLVRAIAEDAAAANPAAETAPTGPWSCRSATTARASRPSTASGCSGSSSGWRARRPARARHGPGHLPQDRRRPGRGHRHRRRPRHRRPHPASQGRRGPLAGPPADRRASR